MQGAIMMAHLPGDVTYRRSQYTYGFDVTVPFIDGDHPEELKFSEGGLNWCNGVFDKVIERNQIVEVGQIFTRSRNGTALDPARKHEERYTSLWRSTRDNPRFCLAEEGVEEVGVIVMKPPTEGWPDRWESENQVIVEETGLTVKRINRNTGEQSEILMTFL
ncbi:heat shock 70 kDa protein 12B-like [Dreissena polymorpha]|nr:heat shock 70 kDa protein 12B-like [Dreissena polymorpha]